MPKKRGVYKPKKTHNIPTKYYDKGGLPISSGKAREILKKGGKIKKTPRKKH
jgi:hypothetical protein